VKFKNFFLKNYILTQLIIVIIVIIVGNREGGQTFRRGGQRVGGSTFFHQKGRGVYGRQTKNLDSALDNLCWKLSCLLRSVILESQSNVCFQICRKKGPVSPSIHIKKIKALYARVP
jgi:hypothetical protein